MWSRYNDRLTEKAYTCLPSAVDSEWRSPKIKLLNAKKKTGSNVKTQGSISTSFLQREPWKKRALLFIFKLNRC